MQSTVPWRYMITYTDTSFDCEDIPAIIREEKNNQTDRDIPRIDGRIRSLQNKLTTHHAAVKKAFQEVPKLVNQIKALNSLGLRKEDDKAKREEKQAKNATTMNGAKKQVAKNQAEYHTWRAEQMNDDDDAPAGSINLGAANGVEDKADEEMDNAADQDVQYSDDDVLLTIDEEEELLELERLLKKRLSAPNKRTLERLYLRREQYIEAEEAKRTPEAVLVEQVKHDPDARAGNRAIKREAKRTVIVRDEPLEEDVLDGVRPPIPAFVEQLLPARPTVRRAVAPVIPIPTAARRGSDPSIRVRADDASIRVNAAAEEQSLVQMDVFENAGDEVKQAYHEEVKEEVDRKRKAEAEERVRRGEAYVRLAKLAKGKEDPPRSTFFGVPLPRWGGV